MDVLSAMASSHLSRAVAPVLDTPSSSQWQGFLEPCSLRMRARPETAKKRQNSAFLKYPLVPTIDAGLESVRRESSSSLNFFATFPLGFFLGCDASCASGLSPSLSRVATSDLETAGQAGFTPQFVFVSVGLLLAFWISNYLAPSLIFQSIMKNKESDDTEDLQVDFGAIKSVRKTPEIDKPRRAVSGFGEEKGKKDSNTEDANGKESPSS